MDTNKPPGVPDPDPIPDQESIEESLEWTEQEEEEFVRMFKENGGLS